MNPIAREAEIVQLLYQSVIRQMPNISLLVCDRDMTIVIADGDALKGYGYPPETIRGKHLDEVFTEPIYQRLKELYQTALGGTQRSMTLDARQKNAGFFRVHSSPLHIDGQIMAAMIFTEDLTRIVETKEALERQNESLREAKAKLEHFALMLAHDLRGPMRTITGFSQHIYEICDELGRYDVPDEVVGKLQDYAGRVVRNTKTLSFKVDATLRFSRLGEAGLEKTWFELEPVLTKLVSFMDTSAVTVKLEPPLPRLYADQELTELVFQNLLENAIKYSPEGEQVRVYAEGKAVFVADNGVGIEPGYHERIFDLFFKMNDRPGGGGHGVGLAMVKRIVEKHGGSIAVISLPGRGATFKVTL